ncbi:MAG: PDZ domain-containing protein [Phycisphaerae bacterium]|nr:PDZ domain-containing protein [Phycisphaerae bacterium]
MKTADVWKDNNDRYSVIWSFMKDQNEFDRRQGNAGSVSIADGDLFLHSTGNNHRLDWNPAPRIRFRYPLDASIDIAKFSAAVFAIHQNAQLDAGHLQAISMQLQHPDDSGNVRLLVFTEEWAGNRKLGDVQTVLDTRHPADKLTNYEITLPFATADATYDFSLHAVNGDIAVHRINIVAGICATIGLGIKMKDGALTVTPVPEGAAAKAGVAAGDKLLAVNGDPVATSDEAIQAIQKRQIGDPIELYINRNGNTMTLRMTAD